MRIGWDLDAEGVTMTNGLSEEGERTVLWEVQMDGGVRCLMNSEGYEETSWNVNRH